jgi:hypothetical protein
VSVARVPKRKIRIRRGDTYTHLVTEYDVDGNVENLTGSSFLVQMRPDPDSTTVTVQFTTEIVDAVNGEWQFSLTSTQTSALTAGVYFYDVQRTYSGGQVHTRFQGDVVVENDISHA